MSSNESTAGASSSLEESTNPQPGRRRRVSSDGSNTYQQDVTHQAERSWLDSDDRTRTPDEMEAAGRSSIAPNASSILQERPDPLRVNPIIQDDAWAEQQRRGNSTSADRKRRLTNSAHNSGRVRTVSGGFHSRIQSSPGSQPEGSSSRDLPQAPRHGPPERNPSRTDCTDPAIRPRPLMCLHSTNLQRPMSTAREVLMPIWQPDSEVSKCPICSRQFTFWFRKHHCRKCGRVVCAGCSPHRITIPRQFIVHPPESSNRMSTVVTNNPVVIDLTAGTGSSTRTDMALSWTSPHRISNPGLGGGEEVRLCNPCVPDPQPSPQATMDLAEFLRQGGTQGEIGNVVERPDPFRSSFVHSDRLTSQNQHSPSDEARELRRQRRRGMIFQPDTGNLNTVQTSAGEIPDESLPSDGNFNYTVIPNCSRRERPPRYHAHVSPTFSPPGYNAPGTSMPSVLNRGQPHGAIPSHLHRSPHIHFPTHSRYSSVDTMTRPTPPPTNRPRIRSMFDADPGFRRFLDQASSSPSSRPPSSPRSRLQESEVCPICRHALPPKGTDGDETAREAHVMECIAARDPSAQGSTSFRRQSMAQPPPPAPIHMLPFTASEKDCVGEDGTTQECSICFVEYDVGDPLARLECLCKFHKACIVEWFSRKQECPVHKIA